jgi:hypothetical protein
VMGHRNPADDDEIDAVANENLEERQDVREGLVAARTAHRCPFRTAFNERCRCVSSITRSAGAVRS